MDSIPFHASYGTTLMLEPHAIIALTQTGNLVGMDKINHTQVVICLLGKAQDIVAGDVCIRESKYIPSNVIEDCFVIHLSFEDLHNSLEPGRREPLLKVNCGALADSILESELFGHVQGAFTGASQNKIGRFHLADGGIIFLDEIGDISPKMQLQLLRVIETMSFEQVGSSKTQRVDVRVVAATNKNLAQKVEIGEFREDLYYRLKVVQLNLPPLRERKDDIPLLTSHMIEKFNHKFKKKIKAVSSDVEKLFFLHAWPGNVRELENTIEHAFILCNQNVITVSHLPIEFQSQFCGTSACNDLDQDMEAQSIERALEQPDGNKAKAARLLSMSRRTIYRKIDKYNITG